MPNFPLYKLNVEDDYFSYPMCYHDSSSLQISGWCTPFEVGCRWNSWNFNYRVSLNRSRAPSPPPREEAFLAEVYRCRRKSIALTDLRRTKQAALDRWIYVKWRRRLRSIAKLCRALRHGVTHLLATLWWQLTRRLTLFVKRHVSSKLNNFPFRYSPYRVINPPSNYRFPFFKISS